MSGADRGPTQTTGDEAGRDPAQIREEIEETRGELGETVAAVAEKTDVKQQAQAKADELKSQASEKVKEVGEKAKEAAPESATEGVQQAQHLAQENPVPLAIGAAFLVGVVVGRLLSR